ncbi:MAG: RagB/SusD family nutrient uptake outer membrane protein [Prevotella sp.]|nr:RagB/SusD family nutrient uptake outer membrane protein [Prevotella sp.]
MIQELKDKIGRAFRFTIYTLLPLVGGGGVGVSLSSCSNMLDTDSELVEFAEDNTLNHTTDSVYSVLGIVNAMQTIADRTVLLGEARGDLAVTTDAASADLKRLSAFDFSQQNKYNQVSDYYAVINNCNYYLAHADTALQRRGRKIFEREYAVVKAYRAWTYLQLVQAYGQVPLVTEPVMTEQEARDAMSQPRKSIADVCNYFITDLTPYAMTLLPDFGAIGSWDPQYFFIPVRVLLGDLCLWAGRYEEAARWYNSYLNDEKEPVQLRYSSRITWTDPSEFRYPTNAYLPTSSSEILSFIPMEGQVFYGTVSELRNIYASTSENNYYFQLTPSAGMRQLSASQVYCMEHKTDARTDTIYVPRTGMLDDLLVGDLRLYSYFNQYSSGAQDEYSEYSAIRQSISKIWVNQVATYRITMVYLRYAEALNRAGLPQSAMAILKYGLCPENVTLYVDSLEQQRAGDLIKFDGNVFTKETTIGVHSLGSGDSQINDFYALPQPATTLANRQDTVDYQIPLVEDLIVNEMALEGAFEGYRFYDLMRVALRRGDNSYLADPISRRTGTPDAALRTKLMDSANWYLPLP